MSLWIVPRYIGYFLWAQVYETMRGFNGFLPTPKSREPVMVLFPWAGNVAMSGLTPLTSLLLTWSRDPLCCVAFINLLALISLRSVLSVLFAPISCVCLYASVPVLSRSVSLSQVDKNKSLKSICMLDWKDQIYMARKTDSSQSEMDVKWSRRQVAKWPSQSPSGPLVGKWTTSQLFSGFVMTISVIRLTGDNRVSALRGLQIWPLNL